MYFRFPVLLIIISALLVSLFYFGLREKNSASATKMQAMTDELDKDASLNLALQSIRANELYAHLAFLADDLLAGRDTGSRGAQLASLYIAGQLQQIGLKPVGEEQTYFQPVPLLQKRISAKSEVKIEIDEEFIPLKYGEDFLIVGMPEKNHMELSRELVFTGFGIQAPEYNYDDFKNIAAEGKITVYVSGEPSSNEVNFFQGEDVTKYASGSTKRKIAQAKHADGAIGVIRPDVLQQMPWDDFQKYLTAPKISLYHAQTDTQPSYFPAIVVHPDVGDLIFAGTQHSFEEVKNAASKGEMNSFDMHKKIQMKILAEEKRLEDRNVVGLLEGSDPVLKSEVVVYTAHYDHIGVGTSVNGDSIYNGAADNASGVAGLIEVAEAFSLLPEAPKRSVLFLAVTAEEKGLLGSEYYVNHPIFPLSKTVANLNFDIIGIGDTTGLVIYGIERSTLGEIVKKAAQAVQLKILPDKLPEQRVFYRSDHYTFAKKGVPAIYPGFGIDKARFQEFGAYYHQPSDDLHLPFHFEYMKKHVQVLFLAGLWVANAEEPPKWTAGDEFEKVQRDR